jgi:small subunit ribosomal protein S17
MTNEVNKTKPVVAVVTSDKMSKSRVAVVERVVKHGSYGKYIRKSTKIMFHDEGNKSKVGDTVLITACRPYSSRKKFTLLEVTKVAAN